MDSKLVGSIEELEKLFSSRMRDYEAKLQKATSEASPVHSDLASLSRDFTDFKSFMLQTLTHIKTQVGLLSIGLDRHETSLRRKVLLLHGVQEKGNENVSDVVVNVFTKIMKIDDVKMDSIEVCHRLGSSQGKTRPILVRFRDMEYRRLVWDNKTTLKGSGVTISEFLTKVRHQVFMAARKHFGMNSCWSAEGKIIILTPDKTRRKLDSMAELAELLVQFPSCNSSTDEPVQAGTAGSPKTATPKAAGKAIRKARR